MTKTRIQHALIILLVVVVCIGLTSCQMILRGMQALVDPDANESAETDIVPTRTPPEPIEPLLTEVIVPPEPTTVPGTYVNNNPDIHTQMTLGGHTYEFNLPPETTFDFNELYGGLYIEGISSDFNVVDLSPLAGETSVSLLSVTVTTPVDAIIVPQMQRDCVFHIDVRHELQCLDLSAIQNCQSIELSGPIRHISPCQNPEILDLAAGAPIEPFYGIRSLYMLTLRDPIDLSVADNFDAIQYLSLKGTGWDLTPLNHMAHIDQLVATSLRDEDLTGLDGARIRGISISDANITDLSWLDRLPVLKALVIAVSPEQPQSLEPYFPTEGSFPEEQLDNVRTPLDMERVRQFLHDGGTVHFVCDSSR